MMKCALPLLLIACNDSSAPPPPSAPMQRIQQAVHALNLATLDAWAAGDSIRVLTFTVAHDRPPQYVVQLPLP